MSQTDLYPISIYVIFSRSTFYHIAFSSVEERLEFSSLEVKLDRFRDRDEGTWQKHPENTHNKRSLIRTSHIYLRCRVARRNQQVEKYKHTHTHTHTHTQYTKPNIMGDLHLHKKIDENSVVRICE